MILSFVKKSVVIFLIMLLYNTAANAQNRHKSVLVSTKQQKTEALLLAKINALYEVKGFMRYAKKSKPLVIMNGDPDSTFNYYRVNVGIRNFDMFRASYHFFVAPRTFHIYIWDQLDEKDDNPMNLISLQQWRRWRNDPRFGKPHTFKGNQLVAFSRK